MKRAAEGSLEYVSNNFETGVIKINNKTPQPINAILNYVPNDVYVDIVLKLGSVDQSIFACVCLAWYRASKDERLRWVYITRLHSVADDLSYIFGNWNSRAIFTKPCKENEIPIPVTLININKNHQLKLSYNDHKDCVTIAVHNYYHNEKWNLFYREYPKMVLDNTLWRIEFTLYYYSNPNSSRTYIRISIDFFLNVFKLERLVHEAYNTSKWPFSISKEEWENKLVQKFDEKENSLLGEGLMNIPIPGFPFILYSVAENCLNYSRSNKVNIFNSYGKGNRAIIPRFPASAKTGTQPEGLKEGTELYQYQLQALNWMKYIEETSENKIEYSTLVPWKKGKTGLLFDLLGGKIVPPKHQSKYKTEVVFGGGCLADEMGLGKTLEVISLILARPALPIPVNYFKKQIKNDLFIKTKATLILCPNHLVSQWKNEFNNYAPQLNVLTVNIIAEHNKQSVKDWSLADVVIISLQFLKNPTYFSIGRDFKKPPKKGEWRLRLDRVNDYHESITGDLSHHMGPLLEWFEWHRFVLDEGHEIIGDIDFYVP